MSKLKISQITLQEIKLVGITARTSNASEMDPTSAKIGSTMQQYFGNNLSTQIPNRKKAGVTYCVYTEYENDMNGDYTYFIGEEVVSFEGIPNTLTKLTIPAQSYAKFTSNPGNMPYICIDLWQRIWKTTEQDLGGQRAYRADFELYDERAENPQNTVLDIFIGI